MLDHVAYIVQDLYSRGFHKLVPLAKDSHTPNLGSGGVIAIADDPKYWNPSKLADNYHKFHNIATTFGPMVLPDGSIGYNHCLDVDSPTIMAILEPYLPEIKKLTFIIQTKKGMHIHWIEHTQHERIGSVSAGRHVKRCMPGFEFEIKTDHRGGTAHLPGAFHRDDVKQKVPHAFQYRRAEGCADRLGLLDDFLGFGLGFYDWLLQDSILGKYIVEPGASKTAPTTKTSKPNNSLPPQQDEKLPAQGDQIQSGKVSSSSVEEIAGEEEEQEEEEEKPDQSIPNAAFITATDINTSQPDVYFSCADRIHLLFYEWYVKNYRNSIMLTITGTIRRSWHNISLQDAEKIIEQFCEIANDEEAGSRLTMLRSTYQAEDLSDIAGFNHLRDIVQQVRPDLVESELDKIIDDIRFRFYDALADFAANNILLRCPGLEINNSVKRRIVVFNHTVEEVDFPEQFNKRFGEMTKTYERKSLLLNAAPIPPIEEICDPLYQQTKYKMTFRSIGKDNQIIPRQMDRPMTVDELEEWIRLNASYYHKPSRLGEVLHAIVDSYNKAGLVNHRIGTEIEGLVYLPVGPKGKLELVLSNMERPAKLKREQAQACIATIREVKTKFYSGSNLETARYTHFLKSGVVAPVSFARRQSGAVNQYEIIPLQDLGGWTDSGKTLGYAAIPLRIYRLPLNKGIGSHSYIIGSGSIDSAARFIEQTRWTTFPVILDEADRYSDWEDDREAKRILSVIKNSTMLTNPRDTLTSDSEQILKPSAAYVMLTHNSALIQEDGFNKRSIGHEFTIKDEKTQAQMDAFNEFWKQTNNIQRFGYLGDYIINFYLDHPDVLNNYWLDISKIILRSFWIDTAGFSEEEFNKDWDDWLGGVVESATSKAGLIETRTVNVISMFRQMINDAWSRNKQQAAVWIAANLRKTIAIKVGYGINSTSQEGSLDYATGKAREAIDDIMANATFAEKLEALIKTDSLPLLVWNHNTAEITIDSSIVKEMRNRYNITRVTHRSLADLLKLPINTVRFGGETKNVIHASLDEFVKKIAPPKELQALEGVL